MTRLRQPERAVLDTLVDAGVARSRSDALAWSVKLVGEHADTWLAELREAMAEVDKLRAKGPRWLIRMPSRRCRGSGITLRRWTRSARPGCRVGLIPRLLPARV